MKMDRIDEAVAKGETEIWRISVDDMLHPFHIHGCSFRILSQNGGPPPAYAQGWKDMVHVEDGWSEVLVRFDYDAPENAPYMYHCHILEHEDRGMSKADQKTLGESIEKLELSSRSTKVLESIGCGKVGDVAHYSDLELYRTDGSGQSVVQEDDPKLNKIFTREELIELLREPDE